MVSERNIEIKKPDLSRFSFAVCACKYTLGTGPETVFHGKRTVRTYNGLEGNWELGIGQTPGSLRLWFFYKKECRWSYPLWWLARANHGYPDGAPLSAYTCVHVTDTFQTSVCCMHACVYKIRSCTCRYTKIRVRWVKRIFLHKRIIVTMSHWCSINDTHRHENVGSHLRNTWREDLTLSTFSLFSSIRCDCLFLIKFVDILLYIVRYTIHRSIRFCEWRRNIGSKINWQVRKYKSYSVVSCVLPTQVYDVYAPYVHSANLSRGEDTKCFVKIAHDR